MQIFKFGMYGFLKNLRFFEPYLLYYFTIISGLSLLQVGVLYSIREIIIYIFEIPSGVIADRYGKKTELVFCFLFYIGSFVLFFLANQYYLFIIGMVLFGLGEAFRSGTHKAMIMQYLDQNKITSSKTKVYGETRSMSMLGSMAMSLISIVFVIWLPEVRYLFLLSIIPYVIDLLLILSYPKYLNTKESKEFEWKEFLRENYRSIKYALTDKPVRRLLFESSTFQAGFKSIKDYIQPIILGLTMSVILFKGFTLDENLKIYIGVIYAFIYLISSITSKNAHHIVDRFENRKILNYTWLFSAVIMLVLSFFLDNIFVIFSVFILFYIFLNLRRPLMVDLVGEATLPGRRASVLSVESQMTSLMIAIFAPILGFIADHSMQLLFIIVSIMMALFFIFNTFFYSRLKNKENKA